MGCDIKDLLRRNSSILLLIALNFIVFSAKVNGQFLADDFTFFWEFEHLAFSWKGLINLARSGTAYFRPLPYLILLPLYKLFALAPFYYHLFTLSIHVANAVLVYILIRKMFQKNAVALVGAGVFSVFTGHIEAVMGILYFFDTLCTFFFLLSLIFLILFLERKRYLYYVGSLAAAMCAILSKENVIVLPAVIFVFSFVRLFDKKVNRKLFSNALLLSGPYFALFFVYLVFRNRVLPLYGLSRVPVGKFLHPKVLLDYWFVIEKFAVPFMSFEKAQWLVVFAVALISIILVLCMLGDKKTRTTVLFGVAWVVVTSFPTVSLANIGGRFFYLPSVGFAIILGQMFAVPMESTRLKKPAAVLACLLIALYSANTMATGRDWSHAWQTSKRIQESFKEDVEPLIEGRSRVYFFDIPEFDHGIICFPIGLPDCFSLLGEKRGCQYKVAYRWTRPFVKSPETTVCESGQTKHYLFKWDKAKRRFQQIFPVSRVPRSDHSVHWDFSRRLDFYQWTPVHELALVRNRQSKELTYITSGSFSMLSSPYLGENVKCVQVVYRAINRRKETLQGQLLWITANDPTYDGRKCITFSVKNDGMFHTYTIPLYINGWSMLEPILKLGLRLSDQPETSIEIDSVTLHF